MTERIAWLDVARGLAIVGVVLFHADLCARSLGFAPVFSGELNEFLQPIRMPLFFTVSGILAAGAIARPWPDLLRYKVWVLVYVFALWGSIRWLFFGQLIENVRNPAEGGDWTQLLAMWVAPTSALWFIWALALYCIIAKAARRFEAMALAAALLLACLTWGRLVPVPSASAFNLFTYLFFFLLGAYAGPVLLRELPRRSWLIGGLALAGFLVLELVVLPALPRGLFAGSLRAVESILGLLAGCAAAILMVRTALGGGMAFIGRHTLPIYVAHPLIISAIGEVFRPFAGQPLWPVAIVPLLAVASIAAALALEATARRLGLPWLFRAPALPGSLRPARD